MSADIMRRSSTDVIFWVRLSNINAPFEVPNHMRPLPSEVTIVTVLSSMLTPGMLTG